MASASGPEVIVDDFFFAHVKPADVKSHARRKHHTFAHGFVTVSSREGIITAHGFVTVSSSLVSSPLDCPSSAWPFAQALMD